MAVVTISTDFTGKVAGSLIENPNIVRYTGVNLFTTGADYPSANLRLPNEIKETDQSTYDLIATQDNSGIYSMVMEANTRPQIIFSFDVIKAIEKTYGQTLWKDKTALVDKIEIAKNIITNFKTMVRGSASNEKTKGVWTHERYLSALIAENTWDSPVISYAQSYGDIDTDLAKTIPINGYIDTEGYIHFSTYGEVLTIENSDGTVLADYAKLEITLNDTLAPEAPTNLTATPEIGAITLSWTGVTGATGYNIYRSDTSEIGYELIGTTGEMVFVDHTSTTDNTTYYYVVTAVNQVGTSEYSNEVTIQAIPEPEPEPEPQAEYTERNIFVPEQYWSGDGINQEAREILVKKYNAGARQTITSQYPNVCIRTYH